MRKVLTTLLVLLVGISCFAEDYYQVPNKLVIGDVLDPKVDAGLDVISYGVFRDVNNQSTFCTTNARHFSFVWDATDIGKSRMVGLLRGDGTNVEKNSLHLALSDLDVNNDPILDSKISLFPDRTEFYSRISLNDGIQPNDSNVIWVSSANTIPEIADPPYYLKRLEFLNGFKIQRIKAEDESQTHSINLDANPMKGTLDFSGEYGNGSHRSIITTFDGYVGINHDFPNSFVGADGFYSDYHLVVKGKILTTELVVKKFDGETWPDYVFKDDYKLMSLDDTEDFINENNHLPGIPSATEVAENGIEIGEMQATILKKVEELTLHLIESNKQIEQLKEENKKLHKLIEEK